LDGKGEKKLATNRRIFRDMHSVSSRLVIMAQSYLPHAQPRTLSRGTELADGRRKLFFANGQLYYLDSDENYALKHVDLQSGNIGTLTADWIGPAAIHAGRLYVVNHSEDWNLYVMNPDGSQARELIAQSVYKFLFTSKGIVTQTERGEIDLHQRQATGEYRTVRLLDYAAKVSIVKDRLLYSLDNGIMYQAALPDKKQKAPPSTNDAPEPLLQPDPPVFGEFFVVGDWLYYYDSMNASAKLHRIGLPK